MNLVENGDILVLTDQLENLSVHYEDIHVEVQDSGYNSNPVYGEDESGKSVKLPYFNMQGDTITFYLPDGYYTLITYQAKAVGEADSNGYIHYHNTADLDGYEKYVDDYEKYSGEATGTATNYGVKLYKANGYVNSQKLAGAKFKLFMVDEVDEDGNIISGTPMKNRDGTDYIVTSNATGNVLVQGHTDITGWNLKPEQRYYLQEVVAPEGCAIDNTKYSFLISQKGYVNYSKNYIEAPDGSGAIIQPWTYFNGDVLTVKNYPIKGVLDIKKTVSGTYTNLSELDDDQKAAVKFEVYKQKDENWVKIKTITLAEFISDTYTIGDLDAGTYKVEEVVNEDQHVNIKTYAVKAAADSVETGQYATVVISEEDIHNSTHHEVDIDNRYEVPSEFKIYKYGDYAGGQLKDLKLANAEFGVFAYESGALAADPVKTYTTNNRGRLAVRKGAVQNGGNLVGGFLASLLQVTSGMKIKQLSRQHLHFCEILPKHSFGEVSDFFLCGAEIHGIRSVRDQCSELVFRQEALKRQHVLFLGHLSVSAPRISGEKGKGVSSKTLFFLSHGQPAF